MPGSTDPETSMKKVRTLMFHKDLQQGDISPTYSSPGKDRRWFWFSGVPKHYQLPSKSCTNHELANGKPAKCNGEVAGSEDARPVDARTLVAGLANFTTSHGITHIYFSSGIIKKAAWSIICLVSLALLGVHLWYVVSGYLSYDVTTNVGIHEARSLDFPAVTICNNNAIKKSAVPDDLDKLIKSRRGGQLNGSDIKISNLETHRRLSEKLSLLPQKIRKSLGYKQDEMIIYCSFNGENCQDTDFWRFHDSHHGNCYTYNSGKVDGASARRSNQAGSIYGLSLVLNIGVYDYLPFITEASGIRIVIHHQDAMPFPDHNGISASPGHVNDVGVNKISLHRLGGKYGNCTGLRMDSENMYAVPFKVKYTQWACLKTCCQREVVRKCTCYDPDLPYDAESVVFANLNAAKGPCRTKNSTEKLCSSNVMDEFSSGTLSCAHCYQPCKEEIFDTSLSMASFPARSYMRDFISRLNVTHPRLVSNLTEEYQGFPAQADEAIKTNFLKLNIFYQSLTVTRYREVVSYDDYQFVSDLGGTFGLWIGWSVLTMFELVGFIADLMAFIYYKQQLKK